MVGRVYNPPMGFPKDFRGFSAVPAEQPRSDLAPLAALYRGFQRDFSDTSNILDEGACVRGVGTVAGVIWTDGCQIMGYSVRGQCLTPRLLGAEF